MTSDDTGILTQLEEATSELTLSTVPDRGASSTRELFTTLRQLSRDTGFLTSVDKSSLVRLVSIYVAIDPTDLHSQLDCAATIANVLCINVKLREQDTSSNILKPVIPVLYAMLDAVSERKINSESQYTTFLPIFRLYFFLAHIPSLLETLRDSTIKISRKLLNFVTMSTIDSLALNAIIIEILKILYTTVHQVSDTSGIDSAYVLSCNKFNLLYAKRTTTSAQYDEILQLFGNVLMVINTEYSRSYMLNKMAFATNQVCLVNKHLTSKFYTTSATTPVPALLTLDSIMSIDNGESGIELLINETLDIDALHTLADSGLMRDPHLPVVLQRIEEKISKFSTHASPLEKALNGAATYKHQTKENVDARPRFEDLSEKQQDEEIAKMEDLFGRIEKNGVFKLQMK